MAKVKFDESKINADLFEPQYKQSLLLSSPCLDIVYGGARGGGKSHGMGLDIINKMKIHVDTHETPFKVLVVRKQLTELSDLINAYRRLYAGMHLYNKNEKVMTFPPAFNDSVITFSYLETVEQAEQYQGHQYHYIYIEEMGNYPLPDPIDLLMGCLRGSSELEKCYFRASCNPGGLGHVWIKQRYVEPSKPFRIFDAEIVVGDKVIQTQRQYIPATLDDNKYYGDLYKKNIIIATQNDPEKMRAWLEGDWDIVTGGSFFAHSYKKDINIIPQFKLDKIDQTELEFCCSFDWGNTKPYSVGFYLKAIRDTTLELPNGKVLILPMDSVIRFDEIYGCVEGKINTGLPYKTNHVIADEILAFYNKCPLRVQQQVADSAIFANANRDTGKTINDAFKAKGIYFTKSAKGSGSRVNGLNLIKSMLIAAAAEQPTEPVLYITENCRHFNRTILNIEKHPRIPDDTHPHAEDHCIDELRYLISCKPTILQALDVMGI